MDAAFGRPPSDGTISIEVDEGRYDRLQMIPWWDQSLLQRAKVIVVGAGAIGNEIIKNCSLLGVGNLLIVDFDKVEHSNLARSALYRDSDQGASKAQAAAAAARQMNPACSAAALDADITWQVGLGLFRWADVVICGLDNREARLSVNRACWKANTPWVDGATESLWGVARVFAPPDGVCYECTLSEQDEKLMAARNSCGFLAREAYRRGRTPTTPTASAVIAGVEVQEAVKLLHPSANLPNLAGKGFFFDGVSYDCFTIRYSRREDCQSHETLSGFVETALTSDSASLGDVIAQARNRLGGDFVLDLPREMVTSLRCPACGTSTQFYRVLSAVDMEEAKCPGCARVRVPDVTTECAPDSGFTGVPLADLGFGLMEVFSARSRDREVHIEVSGDLKTVFGDAPGKGAAQ